MVVVVKCKKCGEDFPSKLVQTDNEKGPKSSHFKVTKKFVYHADNRQVIALMITSGNYRFPRTVL